MLIGPVWGQRGVWARQRGRTVPFSRCGDGHTPRPQTGRRFEGLKNCPRPHLSGNRRFLVIFISNYTPFCSHGPDIDGVSARGHLNRSAWFLAVWRSQRSPLQAPNANFATSGILSPLLKVVHRRSFRTRTPGRYLETVRHDRPVSRVRPHRTASSGAIRA